MAKAPLHLQRPPTSSLFFPSFAHLAKLGPPEGQIGHLGVGVWVCVAYYRFNSWPSEASQRVAGKEQHVLSAASRR